MSLFVANATSRRFHFNYRVPEVTRLFDTYIEPGHQYKVPQDGPDEIKHIVHQLTQYGARPRSEIVDKDFSGIIFDTKPISVESIRAGMSEVDEAAIQRALDERQKNVIAADHQVAKLAQEAGTGVGSLTLSVQEQAKPGDNPNDLQNTTVAVERGQPKSARSAAEATKARSRARN